MTVTLDDLRDNASGPSPEYAAKQLHRVPDAPTVDRRAFILDRCRGKVVLDIGASGPMHQAIEEAAGKCYGIDRDDSPGVVGVNLDSYPVPLPYWDDVEMVVCGEVIEHLSNPGHFLQALWLTYKSPVIITVPNAHSHSGLRSLERGIENVNIDHVAWYSYRTLKTLLTRVGYEIKEFYWYNGKPRFAEGLIVVAE